MALIRCPACGGEISEWADVCVHCHVALKKQTQERKFDDVPVKEREDLVAEFEKAYPAYSMRRIQRKHLIIAILACVFFVAAAVLLGFLSIGLSNKQEKIDDFYATHGIHLEGHREHDSLPEEWKYGLWVCYHGTETVLLTEEEFDALEELEDTAISPSDLALIAAGVALIIAFLVLQFCFSANYNKKYLPRCKIYGKWLATKKHIVQFHLNLSAREQRKYDAINIDGYKL